MNKPKNSRKAEVPKIKADARVRHLPTSRGVMQGTEGIAQMLASATVLLHTTSSTNRRRQKKTGQLEVVRAFIVLPYVISPLSVKDPAVQRSGNEHRDRATRVAGVQGSRSGPIADAVTGVQDQTWGRGVSFLLGDVKRYGVRPGRGAEDNCDSDQRSDTTDGGHTGCGADP